VLESVEPLAEGVAPPGSKPLTDTALRDLFAELRRALMASIDTQSERITSDVRMLIQDAQLGANSPEGGSREGRTAWVFASLALIVALASAGLWWHEARLRQDLVQQLAEIKSAVAAAPPAIAAPGGKALDDGPYLGDTAPGGVDEVGESAAASRVGAAGTAVNPASVIDDRKPIVVTVPYGEHPLTGSRLEMLRQVFSRLAARNYSGIVEVRSYPGRFCLVGNASEGYYLAPDELAYSRCTLVGNPLEDSLAPSQRESLGYANLVGEFRSATRGTLDIRFTPGEATAVVASYPQISSVLTAGEWNKAGTSNNRVEVRLK
jgi:hypothetical protein